MSIVTNELLICGNKGSFLLEDNSMYTNTDVLYLPNTCSVSGKKKNTYRFG